nr:MAG TPA: hypothetical protein [Caudoviricetes sp.]
MSIPSKKQGSATPITPPISRNLICRCVYRHSYYKAFSWDFK